MSALEPKIVTLLAGNAGVYALVSTRIYPVILPQDPTLPAITYQRVSGGQISSTDGFSNYENPRIQIDSMATTYAGAKAVAAAVFAAMELSTTFKAILIGDTDIYEDEPEFYRVSMDFSVWHSTA